MLLGSCEVIGRQCCNRLHGSHFYLEISAFICKVFIMNLSTSVPTATTIDLLRSVVVVCFPVWPNGVWCQCVTAMFPCLSSACLTKTAEVSSFHLLLHFHRCSHPASVNHAAEDGSGGGGSSCIFCLRAPKTTNPLIVYSPWYLLPRMAYSTSQSYLHLDKGQLQIVTGRGITLIKFR